MEDEKDYVSFETALALKRAGFRYPYRYYYSTEGAPKEHEWVTTSGGAFVNFNIATYASCSMPSLWQAQKWLREVKNIDVLIWNCASGYGWEISKANNGTTIMEFDENGEDETSGK